jgi:hypothetical protein
MRSTPQNLPVHNAEDHETRPRIPTTARSASGVAVDRLADQVGAAAVPCVLLDHVNEDPPKAEVFPAPPRAG